MIKLEREKISKNIAWIGELELSKEIRLASSISLEQRQRGDILEVHNIMKHE